MKRIILDCFLLSNNSGISNYFDILLYNYILNSPNNKFIILTSRNQKIKKYLTFPNISIHYLNMPKFINHNFLQELFYGLFYLPNILKKQDADILISPYYHFIIPKKFRYKTITTIHDLCYFECRNIYKYHTYILAKFFFKHAIKYSKSIITVSSTSEKKIKEYFSVYNLKNKPIEIIYNVFQNNQTTSDEFHSSLKDLKKFGRKLIYTGGYERRKNLSNLFKAFKKVIRIFPDIILIITGNLKKNANFIKLIKSYKIDENIIITGLLNDNQMSYLYKSDLSGAINISFCEGFGRNNYEAKIFGIPLLCSNIEINHEIVENYPVYCDPNDINDIYNGIIKLLSLPRNNQLKMIDKKFSLPQNLKRFSILIDNALQT